MPRLSRCHFVSGSSRLTCRRTVLSFSAGESGSCSLQTLAALFQFLAAALVPCFCYRCCSGREKPSSCCCSWMKNLPILPPEKKELLGLHSFVYAASAELQKCSVGCRKLDSPTGVRAVLLLRLGEVGGSEAEEEPSPEFVPCRYKGVF